MGRSALIVCPIEHYLKLRQRRKPPVNDAVTYFGGNTGGWQNSDSNAFGDGRQNS